MIKIVLQTGSGLYDDTGRQIAHWDDIRCSWIVNKPYNNARIDWGESPGALTKAEHNKLYPRWKRLPSITVHWFYDSIEQVVETYGEISYWKNKYGQNFERFTSPYVVSRNWNHLDYSLERAKSLGSYSNFDKSCSKIVLIYNDVTHELKSI